MIKADNRVANHGAATAISHPDPLLVAARVMLYVLLAGVAFAAVMMAIGLAVHIAANGIPWRMPPADTAWRPISDALFALGALYIVGEIVVALLAMIGAVARGAAFEPANVVRLEKIAWNTIGLAILGIVAAVAGSRIGGDINGFEIGVDLPTSVGFALLLFVLARVFRQGAAMQDDLEGTV